MLGVLFCGHAQIRDGGIDPWNLGKGVWVFSMLDATNKAGGHITSVTNENSLMLYYKSQGIRYFIVKAATNDKLFGDCYPGPQFTSNLVNVAHTNGILIFGYNRSYGSNIVGEVSVADYVFNQGADGFVFDAEAEWETGHAWITNGPAQAWQLCSTVRSNWPNKFLAHAPFPIIYVHASFPYKEFGFWCDAVIPQIYHFSATGIKGSPSAAINWSDVNWAAFHTSLAGLAPSVINGLTINWTNAIKPILPLQDVYGNVVAGGILCEGAATAVPDKDVLEFTDYTAADPHTQTPGGYRGVNYWRTDTIGNGQWPNIKSGTSGNFAGTVNNLVLDDATATISGAWTAVKVFGATTTSPSYFGATGSDTNCFGTNYFSKAQGAGTAYVQFTPNILVAGDYDVYQWHPYVPNASSGTPFAIAHSAGTTTIFANQQTNSGNWSLLGRFNFATGTNGNIRVLDNFSDAANLALADGVKLVFVVGSGPPIIAVPPSSATNIAGSSTVFSVTALGSTPLAYQWRFNNVNVPNATNTSYTRSNVQTNDAGSYTVVVTNVSGSITSAPAVLTVNFSLALSVIGGGSVAAAPAQSSYTPGTTVTLTATPNPGFVLLAWSGDASGAASPLNLVMTSNRNVTATFSNTIPEVILDNTNAEVTYSGSWTVGTTSADKYLADYRFAGTATNATLTATYRPNIITPGYYDVFLWYPVGSNRATNAPWSVVFNGGSTNVAVDQTINGGGWRLLAAARPFAAGTTGYVQLSNNSGATGKVVMADGVRFTYAGAVNAAPAITTQPQSQTVKAGSNVTFTVSATGFPAPAYQWRFNSADISGATNLSYTRLNAQAGDAGNYSVLVTNVAGGLVSSNALLIVTPLAPLWFQSIAAQPDGRMTLVVTGEPGYAYWLDRGTNLSAWQPLTNLFNTNGTSTFTDDSATNLPSSFYRARQ